MQTATTESTKVIPAALFDELKRQADAAGGVGYGASGNLEQPSCLGDFAAAISGQTLSGTYVDGYTSTSPAVQALLDVFGDAFGNVNDNAVRAINTRKGTAPEFWHGIQPRVTFDELVAELGLVRGEA